MSTFCLWLLLAAYIGALGEAAWNWYTGKLPGCGLVIYLVGAAVLSLGVIVMACEKIKGHA